MKNKIIARIFDVVMYITTFSSIAQLNEFCLNNNAEYKFCEENNEYLVFVKD
jgi:hypothetical protein